MNKRLLSEDICTKFITPAVKRPGWDVLAQIREEVGFTKGRIIVRGKLVTRGKALGSTVQAQSARLRGITARIDSRPG